MKRLFALLLALTLALCALSAMAEEAAAPEGTAMPERGERPEGLGGPGDGGPGDGLERGGAGGRQGGGMAASSEPDEALQAILDEVQDKYELLSFTD